MAICEALDAAGAGVKPDSLLRLGLLDDSARDVEVQETCDADHKVAFVPTEEGRCGLNVCHSVVHRVP